MSGKIEAAMEAINNGPKIIISADYSSGKDITAIMILGEKAETVLEILGKEADRAKGCAWCRKYKLIFEAVDDAGNTITVGDNVVLGGDCNICPVCGRDLMEEAE